MVQVRATLQEGYRIALWSRVASRVLLPLVRWEGDSDGTLYDALREIPWWEHFDASETFAIGRSQTAGSAIPSHFWVQRAKDAVVDRFRDHGQSRPSVDKEDPAIRFHLHVGDEAHEFALDFTGGGQHRRGYRQAGGRAPLKENLAATILYLAGWPQAAKEGLSLVDPTCGSGTFVIEAALMATRCAPGLLRKRFGFERWRFHDRKLFEAERAAARDKRLTTTSASIAGYDVSSEALAVARTNAEAAGVGSLVALHAQHLDEIRKPTERGIIVCNPPYGHRLGDEDTLFLFYQSLGDALKKSFGGWTAYLFAAHNQNLKRIGLRPTKRHVLYNGSIECRLLEIPVREGSGAPSWRKPSPNAEMFVNRIKKNRRKWERWARRERTTAYRLYDSDIPEYNVAIDRYTDKVLVHVYSQKTDARAGVAQDRLQDVLLTLPASLSLDPDDVIVKSRHRHEEGDQYLRLAEHGEEIVVQEGDLRFVVNLRDRIDTGLFLDHRNVRKYALTNLKDQRVLNLFAYTCSVSAAAAAGGAQTTSVDLSNTYLDWGRRNFEENDLVLDRHRFVRDDVTRWMGRCRDRYDWIFINPPTFSRSKKTKGAFNIHQHHGRLIEQAMNVLAPHGELLFTTHARSFKLDARLGKAYEIVDSARALVPADFARSPFVAFTIRHRR